jgi:hypothetical protein
MSAKFEYTRVHNALLNNYRDPPSFEQLVLAAAEHTDEHLLRLPGIGKGSVKRIRELEIDILHRRLGR